MELPERRSSQVRGAQICRAAGDVSLRRPFVGTTPLPALTSSAYRPSFQGQNRSSTSRTIRPSPMYPRASRAAGTSTRRTHSALLVRNRSRFGSSMRIDQRLIHRSVPRLHPANQVDVEHEPPYVGVRIRRGRDQLLDRQLEIGERVGPAVLHAIGRVRVHHAVRVVHGEERGVLLLRFAFEEERSPPTIVQGDHARST